MSEFTQQDKLEVIEHMITQWRPARSSGIEGERDTYLILKSIASDIRARLPNRTNRTLDRLRRAIADAKDLKTETGYRERDMRKVAETLISEWPVILRALEQLEQQGKTDV